MNTQKSVLYDGEHDTQASVPVVYHSVDHFQCTRSLLRIEIEFKEDILHSGQIRMLVK